MIGPPRSARAFRDDLGQVGNGPGASEFLLRKPDPELVIDRAQQFDNVEAVERQFVEAAVALHAGEHMREPTAKALQYFIHFSG
jgi:hypothetical protein